MAKNNSRTAKEQERQKKHVCFAKRRKGLFRKASELCNKCDTQLVIVMLSEAGNPYAFGHPSPDEVLDHYLAAPAKNQHRQTNYAEGKRTEMDIKEWIVQEFEACQTVQELETLKIKFTALLKNINKKLIQDSASPSSSSSSRGGEKEKDRDPFGSSIGDQFIICMEDDNTTQKSNFDHVGKNSGDFNLDALNAVPLTIYNPINDTAYSLDNVYGGFDDINDVGMKHAANQHLNDVVWNATCTDPVSSSLVEPTANGGGHDESARRVNFQRQLPVPHVFVYNKVGSGFVRNEADQS